MGVKYIFVSFNFTNREERDVLDPSILDTLNNDCFIYHTHRGDLKTFLGH